MQQPPSDLQAPFHPPGERGDHAAAPFPELDHLEDVAESFFREVARHPVELRVETQILLGRQILVQRRVLEHETDVPSDVCRMRRHVVSGDPSASCRRAKQRTQDADRRGFSRPVRAEEPERFPDGDVERDVIDRGDVIEDLAEVLDQNGGLAAHATSPWAVRTFVMTARRARRPDKRCAASSGESAPISLAAIAR
jgi:hypothetical protein